jgi:hypothetical protein
MKVSTTEKSHTDQLIKELEAALTGGNAHASFDDAVKDFPHDLLGSIPNGLPYSIWQLVEHIRITQWDILEFCRDPHHESPHWPDDYWPAQKSPAHAGDWKKSLDKIAADRKAFIDLLHKEKENMYIAFPHGSGQSLFREALLIVDHTSYHTGEIIIVRRLLKAWK